MAKMYYGNNARKTRILSMKKTFNYYDGAVRVTRIKMRRK